MFICQSGRVVEPHEFVNATPPIVLLNVGETKLDSKTGKITTPSVKQLPFMLLIGKQRQVI